MPDLHHTAIRGGAGVSEDLEALLRPAGKGGRPRALSVEVLLAALVMSHLKYQNLLLVTVHSLLLDDLDTRYQRRLGVRDAGGNPITMRQVYYLWSAIAHRLDYSEVTQPQLTAPERRARLDEVTRISGLLTQSASMYLPPPTTLAVDLTAVDAAHRARSDGTSDDPDASHGYRTKTQRNGTDKVYGYQWGAVTRAPRDRHDHYPRLFERALLLPANANGRDEILAAIDDLNRQGTVTEVISDRGFTYSKSEHWAILLHERGIRQVMDIHPADSGPRPHPDGYVMLDGWPHCPNTPEDLHRIRRVQSVSSRLPSRKKHETLGRYEQRLRTWEQKRAAATSMRERISRRMLYRFEPIGKTSAGNQRFRCPARAGRVACHGCPMYPGAVPLGIPQVNSPKPLPKACAQETITVPQDVNIKLRQQHYWLSREWAASYNRRGDIERAFSQVKSKTGLERFEWTRQVGITKTALLAAIVAAAYNFKWVDKWARSTGFTDDPVFNVAAIAEFDDDGPPGT